MNILNSRDYMRSDPFYVGFDRIFDRLNSYDIAKSAKKPSYPPYNIHQRGDSEYVIEMAIAGFTQDDLSITIHDQQLTISGSKSNEETSSEEGSFACVHRGIGKRNFKLEWNLADTIDVVDAEMKDGILTVYLVNEVPEEAKPKRIPINDVMTADKKLGILGSVKKKLLTE